MTYRYDGPEEFNRDPAIRQIQEHSDTSANLDLEVARLQSRGANTWGIVGLLVNVVGEAASGAWNVLKSLRRSRSDE